MLHLWRAGAGAGALSVPAASVPAASVPAASVPAAAALAAIVLAAMVLAFAPGPSAAQSPADAGAAAETLALRPGEVSASFEAEPLARWAGPRTAPTLVGLVGPFFEWPAQGEGRRAVEIAAALRRAEEGAEEGVVAVALFGLADDSVRDQRFVLIADRDPEVGWRLREIWTQWRCWRGGPPGWTARACP